MDNYLKRIEYLRTELTDIITLSMASQKKVCLLHERPEDISDDVYQQLPYIKHNGKKYIVFGFKLTKKDKIKAILLRVKPKEIIYNSISINKLDLRTLVDFVEYLNQNEESIYPYRVDYFENNETLSNFFYDYIEATNFYNDCCLNYAEVSFMVFNTQNVYEVKFTNHNDKINEEEKFTINYRKQVDVKATSYKEAVDIFNTLGVKTFEKYSSFVEVINVE